MSEEKTEKPPVDIDIYENAVDDLLNEKIDATQNILGHRWLERSTFATLIGSSGIGKSVAAVQMGIESAAGLPVFGIPSVRPLKVLIIQSEDSKNDRITQVQCIREIAKDPIHFERVRKNLGIYTTTRRGYRLFHKLEENFTNSETGELNCEVDLFILNPAFAFFDENASVENSKDVGFFLRSELMPFLQKVGAAAVIVHHTPKLTNDRDMSKLPTQAFMYGGHGSAEWTNAPRAVMFIENTFSSQVYKFRIAKRGSQSGWQGNNGEYLRYFSHAPKCMPMHWIPSTEEEIAESLQKSGLTDTDVLNVFTEEEPEKTIGELSSQLNANGFDYTTSQIDGCLKRLINHNKLRRVGGKYVLAKIVKKAEKEKEKAVTTHTQMERVFSIITASMPSGIITKDIFEATKDQFGKDAVKTALDTLLEQQWIRVEEKGMIRRYFAEEIKHVSEN